MNHFKKPYELKNMAKDMLQGRYGSAMLILLIHSMITGSAAMFISFVNALTEETATALSGSGSAALILSVVFEAIYFVAASLLGIMQAGISLFFLNMACGQPYSLANLFYGFQKDSGKFLILSGASALCNVVCLSPYEYMAGYFFTYRDSSILPYTFAVMAVGLCIYVPVSLGLSQSFYLMLDYPDRTAKEILALSFQIMKKKKGKLFYLQLSFLPMLFLCVLSCGIGFLWVQPYMQMTYACFFLDIMKPSENR